MPSNRHSRSNAHARRTRALDEGRRRSSIALALLAAGAALPRRAGAQRPPRTARIGWLGWIGGPGAASDAAPLESLRTALRGAGWIEGRNLVIESRAGQGVQARELTAELIRLGVALIVAQGPMVFGARTVAGTLPLVFTINGDPVEAGLVSSFARPGANMTGITALVPELSGKRLELLKECMPALTRVAALGNASHPGVQTELRESELAARRLGLALRYVPLHSAADFAPALASLAADATQAIVAFPDTLIESQQGAIAAFAVERRVPAISGWSEFAAAGNLMSYGPNRQAFYRRTGVYADRILRGARPAELPVEQPTRFDLTVNLKAAAALGLRVPQSLLLRADSVTPA